MESERFSKAVNGEWRIAVDASETRLARLIRRGKNRIGRVEFRQQAVEFPVVRHGSPPVSFTSSRISKIEITGKKRMNSRNRKRNNPMDPMNVAQSQIVG